jgi:hypothetical protein
VSKHRDKPCSESKIIDSSDEGEQRSDTLRPSHSTNPREPGSWSTFDVALLHAVEPLVSGVPSSPLLIPRKLHHAGRGFNTTNKRVQPRVYVSSDTEEDDTEELGYRGYQSLALRYHLLRCLKRHRLEAGLACWLCMERSPKDMVQLSESTLNWLLSLWVPLIEPPKLHHAGRGSLQSIVDPSRK